MKPNTFEFAGNKAIKFNMLAKNMPYSICLNWPVVTVITVNKVQDVYKTPIYNLKGFSHPEEETKDQVTPEEDCLLQMNRFFIQKKELDAGFYARQIFPAVHIATFQLSSKDTEEPKLPSVAVVMPVYNTN